VNSGFSLDFYYYRGKFIPDRKREAHIMLILMVISPKAANPNMIGVSPSRSAPAG
jgi:hypothetical protein